MIKRVPILMVILILFSTYSAAYAEPLLYVENFVLNDKLPSNSVTRIYNDKEGYIWLGTEDGLCRFDGYDLKTFKSSASTPNRLVNNEIEWITEDNNNRLWIGTYEGINILDKNSFAITKYDNPYTNNERINYIFNDSKGFIWIGTNSYGVLKINPENNKYERFSTSKNSRLKLKGDNVKQIYEDKDGIIWITTWKNGICAINQAQTDIYYAPAIGKDNNPFRVYEDNEGIYWIATWGDGLYNMTVDGKMKINFTTVKFANQPTKNSNEITYSILQDDKYGYIWTVTFNGLQIIKKNNDGTYDLENNDNLLSNYSSHIYHDTYKDKQGNIWLGSVGEGLFFIDLKKLPIQNYQLVNLKKNYNADPFVTHICNDEQNSIYLAINRFGLVNFNLKTREVVKVTGSIFNNLKSIIDIEKNTKTGDFWIANEGDDVIYICKPTSNKQLTVTSSISVRELSKYPYNSINDFFEDIDGNMWIGTSYGLFMKPLNNTLQLISSEIQSVVTLNQDLDKNIWISTEKDGLYEITPLVSEGKQKYIIKKRFLTKEKKNINVQSICCKKNGDIFLGTKEGYIYQFNIKNKKASEISGLYGIADERILDITEDNYGFLWISTVKRIIRYNPLTHASSYFSSQNGVTVGSFNMNSHVKLNSGQLIFGASNGIVEFNPTNQTFSEKVSVHVALTDILIENASIFNDTKQKHFNAKKNTLIMKWNENNLSIEFAALNQLATTKSQYAYKLSGINKDWNYVGSNRRYVNYADIPPGNYTFMVKASDKNGNWSDNITTLEIYIRPPFYKTWWAYLFYFLLLLGIFYLITRNLSNRIRLQNDLKISRIEKEKSEELNQVKLKYFTNVTHELLTPLTIIMLQIEKMKVKFGGETTHYLILKDNINRLNKLIKQIIDFRKNESGNLLLAVSQNDIVPYIHNICLSNFKPLISENNINFKFESKYKHYDAYFDANKLDDIIYNILSNAFKHTPKGGNITVKLNFEEKAGSKYIILSIKDNGEGISESDLPNIFKRFYISKSADQSQSHGIGLALTSDLINLHKGTIQVYSKLGEGANFIVRLPISESSYSPNEIATGQKIDTGEYTQTIQTIVQYNEKKSLSTAHEAILKEKANILIIEDNHDLRFLLSEYFSDEYQVLTAENGAEGLKIINENNDINLVISDVMTPEMDGLTFCRTIKGNPKTKDITILLLTAKNTPQDRIESYNAGADSYISKPFEFNVLNARVKNLIKREKNNDKLIPKAQDVEISQVEYNSMDEQFLTTALKVVEDRLSDETLNFDEFAASMAVAKSTLHRKLKSLTGLSPVEFIRNVRLKHAAQMLKSNSGNISEIAFSVGFNDPKYFSRCFKNEFGKTPKEYQESSKK